MLKIKADEYTSEQLFAALKLLEQLCWDQLISSEAFQSILEEYASYTDLTRFSVPEDEANRKEHE